MKSRRLGLIIAATTVTAVTASGGPALAQQGTVEFSVSNITDLHGHLERASGDAPGPGDEMGVALLQALIKSVNEGQEYALTSSGDNVGGSAFISAISEDKYTIDALNAMGMSASAVGNHEFDKGVDDLQNRIAPASNFPILGANVLRDGKPIMDASYVEEIDGVKVGYVGTVTQNTAAKVSPAALQGVEFGDPAEATNAEAQRLKESGEADVVIALMHEDAAGFAEQMNNHVDVLFGGDTHQKTKGEVPREGALPLYWAQGHEYGKLLNDVDITFDKDAGKVTNIALNQYDYSAAAGLTEDPAIAEIVAQAADEAAVLGQEVVGTLDTALFRGSDEGDTAGSNRGVESTFNNYIADAQRQSLAATVGKEIDLGIMNAGGVRADLPAGEVTYDEVFEAQPFGNSVAYGTVSGAAIIQALENQWQPEAKRPRLAMGLSNNAQVVYDQTGEHGSRIKSVTINGEQVDPNKDYTVAASTFLIGGGDGYFAEGDFRNVQDVGYMDIQALIDYIKSGEAEIREGQGQIGVHPNGEFKAGETVSIDLSSLNYTTEGEPMAKTVTVKLGESTVTADIDNAAQQGDAQFGERGRATVELEVPAGMEGAQQLEISTDAGTAATLPVEVLAGEGGSDEPEEPTKPGEEDGSDALVGSSTGLGFAAVIAAALAGIIGFIGFNPQVLPTPIREIFEDLRKQFGF